MEQTHSVDMEQIQSKEQEETHSKEMGQTHSKQGNYGRFLAMIATSTVVMFFLTYLNSYQIIDHARFSETRLFMSLLMGGAMMIIMLAFMLSMYKNAQANWAIFIGAGLLMIIALWLVRSQVTVGDEAYMKAMIPHHSIAILTSERSGIEDVRVRKLADDIIDAQQREIKEMDWLIEDIRVNGLAETQDEAGARPVPQFSGSGE